MHSRERNVSLQGRASVRFRPDRRAPVQLPANYKERRSAHDLGSLYAALEHQAIAAIAHRYWRERGCPEGSAVEDWLRAEQDFGHRTKFGYSPDDYEVGPVLGLPH
jgi:hypothetical protein